MALRTKLYNKGEWHRVAKSRERRLVACMEIIAEEECLSNCSMRLINATPPQPMSALRTHLCPSCLATDALDIWADEEPEG